MKCTNLWSLEKLDHIERKSASPTLMFSVKDVNSSNEQFKKIFVKSDYTNKLPDKINIKRGRTISTSFSKIDVGYFKGLEYESKVYSLINDLIIEPNVSEYFVKPSSNNNKTYSYHDLESEINSANKCSRVSRSTKSRMVSQKSNINLLKEVFFSVYYINKDDTGIGTSARPIGKLSSAKDIPKLIMSDINLVFKIANDSKSSSVAFTDLVNSDLHSYTDLLKVLLELKNCMLSEVSTYKLPNSNTLNDVFKIITTKTGIINNELLSLVFQGILGCFTLGINLIEHNDMHVGNVLVQTGLPLRSVKCIINDKKTNTILLDVNFNTKLKLLHFDWDRSHAKLLGNNPNLEDSYLCGTFHQCNNLVDQFPLNQQTKISILRNMILMLAWIIGCGGYNNGYNTKLSNYLIKAISLPDKIELVKELFYYTCISNSRYNNHPFFETKDVGENPLGLGDSLEVGESYLSPDIYNLFRDPLDILIDIGNDLNSKFVDKGITPEIETNINLIYNGPGDYINELWFK